MGYQTPHARNKVLDVLGSNWRLTGILTVRSGEWLNITTGVDNALNGQLQQRPNKVSDDVYGPKTRDVYLNRAAFASPDPGTFGNLEYRAIEGPGFWTVDAGLSRFIGVGGRRTLELRVESFNVTNNFNWGNPGTVLSQATFGRITSLAGTPPNAVYGTMRIMQFGVKYGF